MEADSLELATGLKLAEVVVQEKGQSPQRGTKTSSRRATLEKCDGRWHDQEGTVPVTRPPPRVKGKTVTVFGEPLLRRRPQPQPNSGNLHEMETWLRSYHSRSGHTSGAEMAQTLRDAGADPILVRMARNFRCPICDQDRLPAARRQASFQSVFECSTSWWCSTSA